MNNYILELIDRMIFVENYNRSGYESSKTISWKAHREAEQISNKMLIPVLMNFIDIEKIKISVTVPILCLDI